MKAISLFTGTGGLDLGFEAAGFDVAIAVELDADCVRTLRANREWPVLSADIHSVSSEKLLRAGGIGEAEAHVLVGGPPCQPFSKSGYWANGDTLRLDDPRAGTIAAYLRVLRDTLPAAFVLENVEGIAYRGKSDALDLIRRCLAKINQETSAEYSFQVEKLNAANYGVPQLRERVFIVGSREGVEFEFPRPTHAPEETATLLGLQPHTRAWDAIGDLEDDHSESLTVTGKWADLLPSIPEGKNYLWHTERGGGQPIFGWRRRYWSFLLKLAKSQPSWTIQAQPGPATGPFHWNSRRLSARELCRLQTIPDDYEIVGDIRAVQRQVGNAVPSALAEVLALEIRRQFFGHSEVPEAKLIPNRADNVPAPEETEDIAETYLGLVGKHSPHPGTGQGFAAAQREA